MVKSWAFTACDSTRRVHSLGAHVLRCISPAVAQHVRGDDPETLGGEEGDLVPPSQGQVRPTVNEENCSDGLAGCWLCDDVVVRDAIDRGGLVLELGIADFG